VNVNNETLDQVSSLAEGSEEKQSVRNLPRRLWISIAVTFARIAEQLLRPKIVQLFQRENYSRTLGLDSKGRLWELRYDEWHATHVWSRFVVRFRRKGGR
jgi:hypothetical protein